MRHKKCLLLLLVSLAPILAQASSDYVCNPTLALPGTADASLCRNMAYLAAGNAIEVNLPLLLSDPTLTPAPLKLPTTLAVPFSVSDWIDALERANPSTEHPAQSRALHAPATVSEHWWQRLWHAITRRLQAWLAGFGQRHSAPPAATPQASASQATSTPAAWQQPYNPASDYASYSAGIADFSAAIQANHDIAADSATRLIALRKTLLEGCRRQQACAAQHPPRLGGVANDYADYLAGAADFYLAAYAEAGQKFAALIDSSDPWLREVSRYMLARNALAATVGQAADQVWGYLDLEKINKQAAERATQLLSSYLQHYPQGQYADSARGLLRRAHWLAGDNRALAHDYEQALNQTDTTQLNMTRPALVQEASRILLYDARPESISSPLLLASVDLRLMLSDGQQALTAQALAAQQPRFAKQPALYGFLQAAQQLFVAQNPARALQLLAPPHDSGAPLSILAFSQQVLRHQALEALGQRAEAEAGWRALLQHETDPLRHATLELALAQNLQAQGRLAELLAADSPLQNPKWRSALIKQAAPAPLLRQLIQQGAPDSAETQLALYTLLAKELEHMKYQDALNDMTLFSRQLASAASFKPPAGDNPYDEAPPSAALFNWDGSKGLFTCPALKDTVAQLADQANNLHAGLCLGEFYRLNASAWTDKDEESSPKPQADDASAPARASPTLPLPAPLAQLPDPFSAPRFVRGSIYQQLINDPNADETDRSYALYRAVRCYAPVGSNACGDEDVPLATRRSWYLMLKKRYPQSRWAQKLAHYW